MYICIYKRSAHRRKYIDCTPLFSEAERGLQSGSFVELAAAPDPDALCVSLPGMGQSLVLTERRVFNDQETAIGAGGPAEEGQMEDIFLTSTMC